MKISLLTITILVSNYKISANTPKGESHHQKLEGLKDNFNIMGDEDEEIEAFNARVDEELAKEEEMRSKGGRSFFPNQYFREHKNFSISR